MIGLISCLQGSSAIASTTATGTGKVSVTHQSSISIEVTGNQGDGSNVVKLKPALGGVVETGTAAIKVSTNLPGYNLVVKDADDETALVSSADDMYTIPAGTPMQGTSAWGYRVDDAEGWNLMSTASTLVKQSDTVPPEGGDLTLVTFGVSINSKQMEGTYMDEVLFIVVANDAPSIPPTPEEQPTLSNLAYMQDMTPEICSRSSEHETKQLIDKRDGKRYWVAKLKDGECWMTQNLDLDLSTSKALRVADSDVTSDYTPTSKTNAIPYEGSPINSPQGSQYSYDVGQIILATPLLMKGCGYYGGNYSAKSSDNLATVCRSSGFIDVSGPEWQPTFTAQKGTFNGIEYPLVAVNEEAKTYDPHYLVGNYYQYDTATAGTGTALTTKNAVASSSICPKGWMLPASGKNDANQPIVNPNQSKASFYQLLLAYGYPATGGYFIDSNLGNSPYTNVRNSKIVAEDNPASSPMHFVRSGVVNLSNGYLVNSGGISYSWSSAVDSSRPNMFIFHELYAYLPLSAAERSYGVAVRCVAR